MENRINKVHIDKALLQNSNSLGFDMTISEMYSQLNHATDEYIYKQMLSVNVDPKAIELHQRRIKELEAENKLLKEQLETETIYSEYWKAQAMKSCEAIQSLKIGIKVRDNNS